MEPILVNKRKSMLVVEAGGRRISGLADSYTHVPKGNPLAIIGSRNCLEIAVREGSAAEVLKLDRDDAVWVHVGAEGTIK
jgi:S-adenosylmethionine hydrolase